ncbi:MAG: energy transducer TonB [Erythrobacter sp.]
MLIRGSFFAALLAMTASAPAMADDKDGDQISLKPSSEWKLREYDDKCRMARVFGTGENAVTMWMDKGGPGPGVNLTLIGKPVRDPFGPRIRVAFAPGEKVERNYLEATSSAGRPVLAMFGVEPMHAPQYLPAPPAMGENPDSLEDEDVDFARASSSDVSQAGSLALLDQRTANITALKIDGAIRKPLSFELSEFPEALGKLVDCTEKLIDKINANIAVSVTPVRQVEWARKLQQSYPNAMLRAEREGRVDVSLTVNAKGKTTFCEIRTSSGPASFNDSACLELLRHATFEPAKDAGGNPVAGFFNTRITYRLN